MSAFGGPAKDFLFANPTFIAPLSFKNCSISSFKDILASCPLVIVIFIHLKNYSFIIKIKFYRLFKIL
jgi:hypothetical protein